MMAILRKSRNSGASLVEFTLVGIPVIFIVISIFEVSRGMWLYQTMAHAAREGARFAIVHGKNCDAPNSCLKQVQHVAAVIENAGVGLDPNLLDVSLNSDCRPGQDICNSSISGKLYDLKTGALRTNQFPPDEQNDRNQIIEVAIRYPFRSAIAMFWPGAGPGTTFGVANLGASSREKIQF